MTPELAAYFRKLYTKGPIPRCPHIFTAKDNVCMKKRCLTHKRWIKVYKKSFRIPLRLTELRRNVQALDAIEGIQFRKGR